MKIFVIRKAKWCQMLWRYDDCFLYLSVGATKCYVEVNRKLGVGDGCWNLLSNTRTTMKMFDHSVFERIFLPRTIKWSMAANMQDTKFIFRIIELVIGECGWKKKHFHQTLSRRIWFRCKVLLLHSWTHLYQQYQQKWHPCPPSTPACS